MAILMLLRHAKSDWDDHRIDDHDRPLAERGQGDAPRMGEYIRAQKWEPEMVLCSTAARTRETWELLAPKLKTKPKVRFERSLYLAGWPVLLGVVQGAHASVSSLMLIGHNPGLEQLAVALALQPKTPAERGRAETMSKKFPTCALAVLEFEGTWRDVRAGRGTLVAFVRPKDLEA